MEEIHAFRVAADAEPDVGTGLAAFFDGGFDELADINCQFARGSRFKTIRSIVKQAEPKAAGDNALTPSRLYYC